jgi:hypothetical protein
MTRRTVKNSLLVVVVASALALAACGDDETPTSPTQSGPTTSATPPPAAPAPTPAPAPPVAAVTHAGRIANLQRSGPEGLDVTFRIDDFTIVRAAAGTPVISGGRTMRTDALRLNQLVTATGTLNDGTLTATSITIVSD